MRRSRQFDSILPALAVCLFAAPSASAQIVLDKLTACADVERAYSALKAQPIASAGDCRTPRPGLESVLASRTADPSRLCFLRSAPANFLSDFSCVQTSGPARTNAADLTCFRAASLADIQEYKERYSERFSTIESRYLAAAQACAVSAGDTAVSAPELFPPAASLLARFQIGFTSLLGARGTRDSSVFHGFGQTDPAIGQRAPSAIEVVYFIVNSPAARVVPKDVSSVGEWTVAIDDTSGPEREANSRYARDRAPIRINMTGYTISREGSHRMSMDDKLSLADSLRDVIGDRLTDEGFYEVSESELIRQVGLSKRQIREQFNGRVPFGNRDQRPVKLAEDFRIFFNDHELPCTRNGRGLVAAYLMGTEPSDGVQRDFGSIGFSVAGIGECSTGSATRSFARKLFDDALKLIRDELDTR